MYPHQESNNKNNNNNNHQNRLTDKKKKKEMRQMESNGSHPKSDGNILSLHLPEANLQRKHINYANFWQKPVVLHTPKRC